MRLSLGVYFKIISMAVWNKHGINEYSDNIGLNEMAGTLLGGSIC